MDSLPTILVKKSNFTTVKVHSSTSACKNLKITHNLVLFIGQLTDLSIIATSLTASDINSALADRILCVYISFKHK